MLAPSWEAPAMSLSLQPVQYVQVGLALGGGILQASILFILARRKLRSEFSTLFNYLAFCLVMLVVGLWSYFYSCCDSVQYQYVYWSLNFLMISLEFLVMYEVLVNALKPFSALIDLGKMLFRWAAVFLLVAALLTAFATSNSQAGRIMAAATVMERSMRLIECGLLMLFFLFERRLGLSWRSYCMSVALGLSVAGVIDLIASYFRGQFPNWTISISMVDTVCYLGVMLFWAVRFALPEPHQQRVLDSPGKLIFQRWDEALSTHGYGPSGTASSTVESFLPGIERTVDRVMARKAVGR
jgi:hypothetical protein